MKKLIFSSIVLFFLIIWTGIAIGEGKSLTSSAARPQSFDTDGSLLVWNDERLGYDGDLDIYIYNLRTGKETKVIGDKGGQFGPRISENKVVWFDYRHKNADVFVKDLKSGKSWPLTQDKGDQLYPDIERDWVVWLNKGNKGGYNVYLYSLRSGKVKKITSFPWVKIDRLRIEGGKVAWSGKSKDNRAFNLFDISTGKSTQLPIEPANSFAFNGRKIVWDQNRTGNLEIYFYDISTKQEWRITRNPAKQSFPDLLGTKIVWFDNRNNQADIFVYDLKNKKEKLIITQTSEKRELRLWGDRVLWLDFPLGTEKLRGSKGIFYTLMSK